MPAETIKEFLISIRYSRDQTGESALLASLKKQESAARQAAKFQDELTSKVKTLGIVSTTTAASFAAGLFKVAKNYEQLYYVVQRTTASAEGLAKLQFAYGQVGLSGDAAVQTVLRMTNAIKASPGLAAVLRGYSGDDPTKLFGNARDQTKILIDFLQGLSKQAPFVRAQIAGMFGITQDDLERLISTLPDLIKAYDDMGRWIQKSGVDMDKFYKDSRASANDLKEVWSKFDLIWIQTFETLFPDLHKTLQEISHIEDKVLEFNKIHPLASVIEALGSVVVGGGAAIATLRTLLGLVGLGGGAGAGAAAAAAAAAGSGGIGPIAAGLALGAGLKVALTPTPAGNQSEADAEAKLFAEAKRRAGGRATEVFGPPDPGGHNAAWLDSLTRGRFADILPLPKWLDVLTTGRGLPHFQSGGIVPIGAHPGEAVLPPDLTRYLMQVSGVGGGPLVQMADDVYTWLRGGGQFKPQVVPVSADIQQPSPFAILDQNGRMVGGPGHELVTGLRRPGQEPKWIPSKNPLDIIEHLESGGRDVMNYIGDALHTASGYWQITNSTWARYAGMIPGASAFVRAMDAPREIQRAVAQALYNREGANPWENYNPRLHGYLDMLRARLGSDTTHIRHGDRTATMNQSNTFNLVAGGAGDNVTGRLTRITDRLAGDTLRNFQPALE